MGEMPDCRKNEGNVQDTNDTAVARDEVWLHDREGGKSKN